MCLRAMIRVESKEIGKVHDKTLLIEAKISHKDLEVRARSWRQFPFSERMSKRTLDAYLKPVRSSTDTSSSKKLKETTATTAATRTSVVDATDIKENTAASKISRNETKPPDYTADTHPSYPVPITAIRPHIYTALKATTPARTPKAINNQPHLDLLYYEPFIPQPTADEYFQFLRRELPFYRVRYTIKRGPTETVINTPRYTTVFGVDTTSYFSLPPGERDSDCKDKGNPEGKLLFDSKTHQPISKNKYKCTPRPIPSCLDHLRKTVEATLNHGTSYNFVLVNYYASGDDSISYHSDDERFLGPLPNIASLTLGARRDFLMKHKAVAGAAPRKDKPLKLPLGSGDLIIMRGDTQSNWLHSIPKRKGGESGSGRINITLRKAVVPGGTENYYRYNVGDGGLYRWSDSAKEMVLAA
ncbi:DNA repair family protein [Talaromyces stipitatus ATCC 10500]|uniref:DNA repair family protein n=1 Tax=Talaromyces stipitatus (strain ATCC 10500 / CBS 375.48 / QM 6759 / NRRL 1006) TaxID=441959 RepID=B8MQ60_TALSN|nr:DNA repair family protein [Talaromyces stipitatus ATCC 10500]EED13086.1 DNA repair family protein [Talaromyces stipitatus ATCC 10500]